MRVLVIMAAVSMLHGCAGMSVTDVRGLVSPLGVVVKVGEWVTRDREEVFEVTVDGIGTDLSSAREDAFRVAVSQAVGSVMLSTRQVTDGEVRRNEIISYSSGYVHDSKELAQRTDPSGRIVVTMQVWVKRSQLVDGMFDNNRSASGEIQGQRMADSYRSLEREQVSRDALINSALIGYPEAAFDVTILDNSSRISSTRSKSIVVNYVVSWNQGWVNSFMEAAKSTNQVRDITCGHYATRCDGSSGSITFFTTNNNYGRRVQAAFTDSISYRNIQQKLIDTYVVMGFKILNKDGKVVQSGCSSNSITPDMFRADGYRIFVYNAMQNPRQFVIPLSLPTRLIEQLDRVELRVQKESDCRSYMTT